MVGYQGVAMLPPSGWSVELPLLCALATAEIYHLICHSFSSSQVLYVPRHWWHYVESVDDITVSVNSWIELVRIRIRPENDEMFGCL